MKRLRLLRRALWLATGGLWCEEFIEAITPLRGLNSRLGALLDTATIVLSVAVIAYEATGYINRVQERKMATLADIVVATSAAASPRDSGPHPVVRLVSKRDSA